MQVGFKHFFLVKNNKPELDYMCCFTDEMLTQAGDVAPKEFWKRSGVRVCRCLGHEYVSCPCRMANARCLCFYKNAVLSILRLRCWDGEGEPGSVGLTPQRWESPGNSRPVNVRDHLDSLGVLPPQPLFFFNKYNQVNIIMERSLQEASFSFG